MLDIFSFTGKTTAHCMIQSIVLGYARLELYCVLLPHSQSGSFWGQLLQSDLGDGAQLQPLGCSASL